MATTPSLNQMTRPPIVEVVCGIRFTPLRRLNTLEMGRYWQHRIDDLPETQLHPAIADPGTLVLGPLPPTRMWLLSEDAAVVVQVQHDRFYYNWRRRDDQYPRFNEHDGRPGVLNRALAEFQRFADYCASNLAAPASPTHYELAKIDHFEHGQHWADKASLGALLPLITPQLNLSTTDFPALGVQFEEQVALGELMVLINSVEVPGGQKAIKLETRVAGRCVGAGTLRDAFVDANEELNRVFSLLVPASKRAELFGENSAK